MRATKADIETLIKEALQETLLKESVKEGVKFKVNGKELDFGSPEHVRILKGMLAALQSLRDCYNPGSANRHVYASACQKLRRLIEKHSPTSP